MQSIGMQKILPFRSYAHESNRHIPTASFEYHK